MRDTSGRAGVLVFGVVLLVLAAAGCGISVSHRQIGPNRFLVEAEGRNRHSLADVMAAAHEHAAQVCGGEYRQTDTMASERHGAFVDDYGNVHGTRRQEIVLDIQCGPAPPPAAAPAQAAPAPTAAPATAPPPASTPPAEPSPATPAPTPAPQPAPAPTDQPPPK